MKKIKFTQEFVSASFGNVWIGRVMELPDDRADMMIKNGYAEELQPEVVEEVKEDVAVNTDGNQEPPADRPKRGRRAASNLS